MTQAPESVALLQVHLEDRIDDVGSGHSGCVYDSPPHTPAQATALVQALLGRPTAEILAPGSWTQAIAFGRRTVTIAPLQPSDPT